MALPPTMRTVIAIGFWRTTTCQRCARDFGFLCSFRHLANARRNVCNVLIRSCVADEELASLHRHLAPRSAP
jgi:hypothetical protein